MHQKDEDEEGPEARTESSRDRTPARPPLRMSEGRTRKRGLFAPVVLVSSLACGAEAQILLMRTAGFNDAESLQAGLETRPPERLR
jgi:hypothetical protein